MSDVLNKKIKMYWALSPQCYCLFNDFFEPIPNLEFEYLQWKGNKRKVRPKIQRYLLTYFPTIKKHTIKII